MFPAFAEKRAFECVVSRLVKVGIPCVGGGESGR
jgi:hypothetical protein